MNFVEFLGFIVSLAAFIILAYKRARDARRQQPDEYHLDSDEQDKKLREFLKSLDVEVEEEKPLPRPPVKRKAAPKPPVPASQPYEFTTTQFKAYQPLLKAEKYEVIREAPPSRGQKLLQSLPSRKNMLIIHEIFGPPKSLQ